MQLMNKRKYSRVVHHRHLLSKVYRHQDNLLDAKNSLIFALQLSDTNSIESLDVLPRFV